MWKQEWTDMQDRNVLLFSRVSLRLLIQGTNTDINRYCGSVKEYCGDGCQSQYGGCSGNGMYHKRSHLLRRHVMHNTNTDM